MFTKVCTKCKEEKNTNEFNPAKDGRYGVRGDCKPCQYDTGRRWTRANKHADLAAKRRYQLLKRFGISQSDYDNMLIKQSGVCAICGALPECGVRNNGRAYLCVDHDHSTGAVRGLLCAHCNTGLGLFEDSTKTVSLALTYLESHQGGQDVQPTTH